MADRLLYIGWDAPSRGREERAIEVFNESVGYYGRLQQDGRIESFDVAFLLPHGDLGGYFELRGSADQLNAVREDDEFRRLMTDANLSVDGIRILNGYTGQGIADQMAMYREAITKVPQAH
jgi:hypothetical protein